MAGEFVKMTKDGEEIEVFPSLMDEHKALGWKVVEKAPEKAVANTDATAGKFEPLPELTEPRPTGGVPAGENVAEEKTAKLETQPKAKK